MDIVIALLCYFMAYTNAKMLLNNPIGEWGVEQYLLLLVTVGLLAVGSLKAWSWWKQKKKQELENAQNIEQEKESTPLANSTQEDELAFLDELDKQTENETEQPPFDDNADTVE